MAAAMSLELALYSSWKSEKLRQGQRHAEVQRSLAEQQQNAEALPKGLGSGLPPGRSAFTLKFRQEMPL